MQREQLEHLVRAAAAITGAREIVVIGSQAILGQFPCAPPDLVVSIEADLFTLRNPADAELIDGSIGEGSPFHKTFGYYAHGVSKDTARLPDGWEGRLIRWSNENTREAEVQCLEANDLGVSKLIAGREKDLGFVESLLWNGLANAGLMRERLSTTGLNPESLAVAHSRLTRTMPSIDDINRSTRTEFVSLFGATFERSPWIAEATWSKRPFASLDALHKSLCDTVRRADEEKQLDLIRAHPDLVGRAALAGTLTPSSTQEQSSAGLNKLSPEEIATFQAYNQAYRDKFEFPFVICARLNKKEAILEAFPARLENTREQEIKIALEEIYKIARFRLKDVVTDMP